MQAWQKPTPTGLQCLSAVSQFETGRKEFKSFKKGLSLQCLSAVSQFETNAGMEKDYAYNLLSPVPFGGVSV